MLQQPTHDLRAFLATKDQFDVEFFTELTFGGLLDSQARFDCLVVGYNALHKSKAIRDALEESLPETGLCVLHQMGAETLAFMQGGIGVSLRKLDCEADRVRVATGRGAEAEILLHWPVPTGIEDEVTGCTAVRGLTPAPDSTWRTVLEIEQGDEPIPVMLRSRLGSRRAVVCTALLQNRLASHAALLDNAVFWAAGGRPDAVIAAPPSFDRAELVQRKLHLQGTTAIIERLEANDRLDFEQWPLRGVGLLVVPPELDPADGSGAQAEHMGTWLRQGGRIARLAGESLEVTFGASDLRWVAEHFGAWFAARPEVDWHGGERDGELVEGSIVRSRAILEVLNDLTLLPGIDLERLGLPKPKLYANPIRRLLHERVDDDNCDTTAGTTVNVLELDRLAGGTTLSDGKRDRIRAWLVRQCGGHWKDGVVSLPEPEPNRTAAASAEEVIEVARCFRSRDLLQAALGRLADRCQQRADWTISAVAVMKLREAVLTCGYRPGELQAGVERFHWDPGPELSTSPLLASNYLRASVELRKAWGQDSSVDPLLEDPAGTRSRAISTIARQPWLGVASGGTIDGDDELVCSGARALLSFFDTEDPGTHVLAEESAVSPQLISLLLEESEGLRSKYALLQHDQRLLGRARHVIAAAAIALGVVAAYLISLAGKEAKSLPFGSELAGWLFSFAVVMLGALWALRKSELLVSWFDRFVSFVARQVPGLRDRIMSTEPDTPETTPRP
jgi:hypothetical protein